MELESLNVIYVSHESTIQRSHLVKLDAVLHGSAGAMVAFLAWWPYDDQVFRNLDGKVVFGLELHL